MPRLYLDHAATTPLLPEAQAAMADALGRWANPSSPHADGRAARAALEGARAQIAAMLDWNGAVIFTSGATEALAIALTRAKVQRVRTSSVEHDAVLRAATGALKLLVDGQGMVAIDDVASGDLLVVQAANNETGVLQSLDGIIDTARSAGALVLADCAQSASKAALPDADFIAVSAHKLGGPPGVGALLVRDLTTLAPTGGQEQGYRPGTENMPGVMGFAAALAADKGWLADVGDLRARLERGLVSAGAVVVARDSSRLGTIGAYQMPGVAATAQLIQFDLAGISVSAGSACSSGSMKPSHVLAAMGIAEADAREVIRVSFGPQTRIDDVDRFIGEWTRIAQSKVRAA